MVFQSVAAAYHNAGLSVIPLRKNAKVPAIKAWTDYCEKIASPAEVASWCSTFPNGNIGLALGPASGIVAIDVDIEDEEAHNIIRSILPYSPCERRGKKGWVSFYRDSGQKPFKLNGDTGTVVELLATGNQVVIPPSIHPDTLQPYSWNVGLHEVVDQLEPLPSGIYQSLRAALQPWLSSQALVVAAKRDLIIHPVAKGVPEGLARDLNEKLAKAVEAIKDAPVGSRNIELNKAAFLLACAVAATQTDWAPYAEQLEAAALQTGLSPAEISSTLDSAWNGGQKNPVEWIKVACEWAYVGRENAYYHIESGEDLTPPAFRTMFKPVQPEKGTIDNFLTKNAFIHMVQGRTFVPPSQERFVERDGHIWLNTYRAPDIATLEGDWSPFTDHMEYLLPDPEERRLLVERLAWIVRNPGEKLHHAILLRSKVHGVGKSLLMSIIAKLIGESNFRKSSTSEIAGNFQSFIQGKLLVLVEELDFGSGLAFYNRIKDMIDSDRIAINLKGIDQHEVKNHASFVFLTNREIPIQIEAEDRRFLILESPAEKRDQAYFKQFADWAFENLGLILGYLESIDLSTFNPYADAPMTAAKEALIESSATPLARELMIMRDERNHPFNSDVATLKEVYRYVREEFPYVKKSDVRKALNEIGAVPRGQIRIPSRGLIPSSRVSLWILRNVGFWQLEDNKSLYDESEREEGLLVPFDHPLIGVGHISELDRHDR